MSLLLSQCPCAASAQTNFSEVQPTKLQTLQRHGRNREEKRCWCAMTPQVPSAHQRGNFASSSLNCSLSAICKSVMPADFVILATSFDASHSIYSVRGEHVEKHAANWT